MQEFIVAIAVAAISGLSYLAYNHPLLFNRINKVLKFIAVIVLVSLLIWDAAVSQTFLIVLPYIDFQKISSAQKALKVIEIPFIKVTIIYVLLALYFTFLTKLPKLIGKKDGPNN